MVSSEVHVELSLRHEDTAYAGEIFLFDEYAEIVDFEFSCRFVDFDVCVVVLKRPLDVCDVCCDKIAVDRDFEWHVSDVTLDIADDRGDLIVVDRIVQLDRYDASWYIWEIFFEFVSDADCSVDVRDHFERVCAIRGSSEREELSSAHLESCPAFFFFCSFVGLTEGLEGISNFVLGLEAFAVVFDNDLGIIEGDCSLGSPGFDEVHCSFENCFVDSTCLSHDDVSQEILGHFELYDGCIHLVFLGFFVECVCDFIHAGRSIQISDETHVAKWLAQRMSPLTM